MPEKYESKPCGNCGGTVYYRGAGCVTCVSRRTHESYHGQRREIARLKAENAALLDFIDEYGKHRMDCAVTIDPYSGRCNCGFDQGIAKHRGP